VVGSYRELNLVDIFISYPRSARAKVEPIKKKLDALGFDCFFDVEGIDGGAEFPVVIDRALKAAKAVLGCWSSTAFTRPWVVQECRVARARNVLVPVAIERFDSMAVPTEFFGLNYLDLTSWDGRDSHEGWNRTLQAIGKLVGTHPQPSSKSGQSGYTSAPASQMHDVFTDLRATWSAFPARQDQTAVSKFLQRVRSVGGGSGLEFEVEHHLEQLTRAVHDRLSAGAVWRDTVSGFPSDACPEMVTLPLGRFVMGSRPQDRGEYDSSHPQLDVKIQHIFALGKAPVTVGQFSHFISETRHDMSEYAAIWPRGRDTGTGEVHSIPVRDGWRNPGFKQTEDHPVTCVSYYDAVAYAEWLNQKLGLRGREDVYRIPTEAEWEYGCRAGSTAKYAFGEFLYETQACFNRDGTSAIKSFAPNRFGLCDMHGNVSEWCEDSNSDYKGAPTDGSAKHSETRNARVFRGGSWRDETSEWMKSSDRGYSVGDLRGNDQGFRLARTLQRRV
jgi:formylglycine-generating enzyme required for sulfatase activity